MEAAIEALDASRHAQDLRETWQARALAGSDGRMNRIIMSVLAHTFDDAMPVLLRIVYPNFTSITAPFLCTAAKIDKGGHVVADMVWTDGRIIKDMVIFVNEMRMRDKFRRFADLLKLSDADRVEMFKCVQRWVVADRRLDPTFDPQDPDAKRLTVN